MRLALGVLALLVVAPHQGDARTTKASTKTLRKKGKVVRVERGPGERSRQTKWCQIRPDGTATCNGRAPERGELGTVVDETGQQATVRTTKVTPTIDGCGNVTGSEIETETISGDVSRSNYAWAALFDYPASSSTHTVYNSGQITVPGSRGPGVESVWTAFDDNKDDNPELIITYFYCDASGQVTPTGSPGWCIAYYTKDASSYVEQRVDIIRQC